MKNLPESGPLCQFCDEHHDQSRGLSFDGRGVNSCGKYRERLATLHNASVFDGPGGSLRMDLLGRQMAAAPELAEMVHDLVEMADNMILHNKPMSADDLRSRSKTVLNARTLLARTRRTTL